MHAPGIAPAETLAVLNAVSAMPSQLASSACSLSNTRLPAITVVESVALTAAGAAAPLMLPLVVTLSVVVSVMPTAAPEAALTFTSKRTLAPATTGPRSTALLMTGSPASITPLLLASR